MNQSIILMTFLTFLYLPVLIWGAVEDTDIAGINVSDCFSYRLTQVILD